MGNPVSRKSYLFTSESVSEGHPGQGLRPHLRRGGGPVLPRRPEGRHRPLAAARRLRDAGHHQPGRDRRRDARPRAPSPAIGWRTSPAWPSRTSATSRTASTGTSATSRCCCIRSRPTSPRASTAAATRTRAPATRASCSATPASETPELMPAPIYYSHKILRLISEARALGQGGGARPRLQEPGDRALRERQAGRRRRRSSSRTSTSSSR